MDQVSLPTKPEVACSKTVQELVENGDELAQRYIWRNIGDFGAIDLSVPLSTEIPLVDFGRLVSSSSSAMDEELLNLHSALTSWGCFQAVNHGIEKSFLDEVRQVAREFFHLPMAEKQMYGRQEDDIEGYGNDLVLFENQPIDWNDRLYLQVAPQHHQKLKYWPHNPHTFRKVLHDYTAKLKQIEEQLFISIAKSLGLPEDRVLSKFGEGRTMDARFNFYPPCSKPDQVLGLKPHADGSGITILLQDEEVQSLQVLKDNQWFLVPVERYAFFVIVGDQLEIMSNGICKSPVHRAVTNSERVRSSLAMFCSPDPAKEIEPLEELVDDQRPRMFKRVTNYMETYFQYYQQGMRPINAVRI